MVVNASSAVQQSQTQKNSIMQNAKNANDSKPRTRKRTSRSSQPRVAVSEELRDSLPYESSDEPLIPLELLVKDAEQLVDLDISSLRTRKFSAALSNRFENLIREKLDPGADEKLIDLLGILMAEVHVLKSIHIEHGRYEEPNFDIPIPQPPQKPTRTEATIYLNGEITGGNWWHAEPTGRWAGPENESSLYFPRMATGRYRLEIQVGSEIQLGVLDETEISFDNTPVFCMTSQERSSLLLTAEVSLTDNVQLPFHVLKLRFNRLHSPAEAGSDDKRLLAIFVTTVKLTKV